MSILGSVRALIPAWLAALLSSPITYSGRSVGRGTSSKLFAMHHAVARLRYSKYPEAVSIAKTEQMKKRKRIDIAIRQQFRDFPVVTSTPSAWGFE
jgi:hypothetical protein